MKYLWPIGHQLRRALIVVTTVTFLACESNEGGTATGRGGVGGTGGSATGGGGTGAVGGNGGSAGAGQAGATGTAGTGGSTGAGGTGAAGSGGKGGAGGSGGKGGTAGSAGKGGAAGASDAGPGGAGGSSGSGGSAGIAGAGGTAGGKGGAAGTAGAAGAAGKGGAAGAGGSIDAGGDVDAGGSNGCGNTNLPPVCNTEATGPCTINVAGTNRQYFVALPSNYNPNTPYPLVFAWHGATRYATELLDAGRPQYDRGFFRVRENFPEAIYVAAQGVAWSGAATGWANTNGEDVAFTRAMLASLQSTFCVDSTRIFSHGASMGGMMTALLGCEMPEVFRALGVICGSLRGSNCKRNPIPVWFHHGDADTTVPISGGEAARDSFIQRNGCSTTSTQSVPMSDGITTCTVHNSCTSGNYPVVWCPVPGLGHTLTPWAGGQLASFYRQF